MRTGIAITLSAADRRRLTALVEDRNTAQKHAWRAAIVLLTADGHGTAAIMRRTAKSKTCVWRWQERFATDGIDGLLRDKTRRPRIPPLSPAITARVLALTRRDPPQPASHWTAKAMAKQAGVSLSSVQRIWRAHGLQPHRTRRFPESSLPTFAQRLRELVGLYIDPHVRAVVFTADEKGTAAARSIPSTRRGTATVTASSAADRIMPAVETIERAAADPKEPSRDPRRFWNFLDTVTEGLTAGQTGHVVLAGDIIPMAAATQSWLQRHPGISFHHVPPTYPWRTALATCLVALSRRPMRRGRYPWLPRLQAAMDAHIHGACQPSASFVWPAEARARDSSVAADGHQMLDSIRPKKRVRANPTPAEVAAPSADVHISLLTPLGHITVFAEGDAIVAIDFGQTAANGGTPVLVEAKRQLDAYFDGRLRIFDLPLAPTGTAYQQAVWQALKDIPYGTTATYGDIALRIGGSARAIGGACGRNPIPIVIPCHRVVGAGQRLVGYSGGEGPETKQALLRLEGAVLL